MLNKGSLFRRLFSYCHCFCSSMQKTLERFQKLVGKLVWRCDLPACRKISEGSRKHDRMILGLASDTSWKPSMAFLNLQCHGVSEGWGSIEYLNLCWSCLLYHVWSFRELPEACQKAPRNRQGISGPGPVWLMLLLEICASVPDSFLRCLIAKRFT